MSNSQVAPSDGCGRASTTLSRPDSVIERLRIEKADDGGGTGITIAGVFIAANCNVILLVMAGIFIVVGAILTAISYRPRDSGEEMEKFKDRQEWSTQTKVVGPVFLLVGVIMFSAGLVLCLIGWKISKDEREQDYELGNPSLQRSFSTYDEPYMPTVAQALLRHPSFPLIVPSAKWMTPKVSGTDCDCQQQQKQQVIVDPDSSAESSKLSAFLGEIKSRPRAFSVQIPFMGGTISQAPQHEFLVEQHKKASVESQTSTTTKKSSRRNSLPAHHIVQDPHTRSQKASITSSSVGRNANPSKIAFVVSEAKSEIRSRSTATSESQSGGRGFPFFFRQFSRSGDQESKYRPDTSRSVMDQGCEDKYWHRGVMRTSVTVPVFMSPTPGKRDIACFPTSTSCPVTDNNSSIGSSSLDNAPPGGSHLDQNGNPKSVEPAVVQPEAVGPVIQDPNFLQVDPFPLLHCLPQQPIISSLMVDTQDMTKIEVNPASAVSMATIGPTTPTSSSSINQSLSMSTEALNSQRRVTFIFDETQEINNTSSPQPYDN